ncbi:efflux RND transporter permease subunit [Paenibacillus pasadenensis]|uniref:efflux RND transporter permease subunit n=1 Tax=Paenibacillus pasadenensis TaxID=217090 RepID=UPI00203EC4E8|nr:efflux RND transporter permease subunit [Paenibacillus pasadenensis]MCM3747769.1 efflux RND transporter permease subunit [Paenibacillus pasadenensis]
MRSFIEGAFRNKAAVWLCVVLVLGMGVASYFKLPMEFMPEADNPQVTITAIGPGYDAASMETLVTKPLQEATAGIAGKTASFASSGDSYSQVNLSFDAKTDMKQARTDVERAVASVQMPERVAPPYIIQLNTSMIPISWVTLTFDDAVTSAEREDAEKQVLETFQGLEGVGSAQLSGRPSPAVTITPDSAALAQKGVPLQALYGVLQGRSGSASVGESMLDGSSVNLNVASTLHDLETLRKLPVAPGVTLGDVAKLEENTSSEGVSRLDGKDAMVLVITKAAGANAVTVGNGVDDTVERLNGEMPGAELKVLMSTSKQVVHSVNSMMREVLLGALFATLVILVFMRNIRATLVTIVSIPLSLGLTLYLLDLSGVTLNILTLGGVAVAVGRLVDDSIVVIENIFRRLQKEKFSASLVIDATREVATAITASTLTTVAVFLPMGLLRGSLQDFLLPFALTVTYSLLSSLLVALTVIPLLGAKLFRGVKMTEHEPSRRFQRFLEWNLRRKWLPLTVAVLLLAGSIGAYAVMPKGAIDSSDASNLTVTLGFKADASPEKIETEGKKLEAYLKELDGQDYVYMQAGGNRESAQYGAVTSRTEVTYMIGVKKGTDAEALSEQIKEQAPSYPDAELVAQTASMMGGGGGSQVFIDVTGPNLASVTEAAEKVMTDVKPIKDVLKVESNQQELKPVYTLQVDATRAKATDLAQQLQGMLNPVPVGQLTQEDGRQVPVILQPVLKPQKAADLDALTVMTDNGPQKVSAVAKWVKEDKPAIYYLKDGKPYVRITVSAEPSQLSVVGADINKAVAGLKLQEGVKAHVGGASADMSQDFADLGMIALISIGIVYLIMVLTFKTLRAPLAILFTLPLAAIGAVLGLIVTGVTPDFTAMFGALMLIGIVVTNAIVLIDRVKQNEETMTIREALLEAAGTRMRPILMTAIATVCAMLPLVFGSAESGSIVSQSLAIVVIGGLVVATVLTLIIVPCIYELLFFRKSALQRREAAAGAANGKGRGKAGATEAPGAG